MAWRASNPRFRSGWGRYSRRRSRNRTIARERYYKSRSSTRRRARW